jgi:hypothetical protein
MRHLLIFPAMTLTLPANAGLFDDLKFAITGHVKDFNSRSQPDQILEGAAYWPRLGLTPPSRLKSPS